METQAAERPSPAPAPKPSPVRPPPPEDDDGDSAAAPSEPAVSPSSLTVRLTQPISSDDVPGDSVHAVVVRPQRLSGAVVTGRVIEANSSGKERGQSTLRYTFEALESDGSLVPIRTKTLRLRNSRGRQDVDENDQETKHKAGVIGRIGSSIGRLLGGRGNSARRMSNRITARGPRILLAAGSEFDLAVEEGRD